MVTAIPKKPQTKSVRLPKLLIVKIDSIDPVRLMTPMTIVNEFESKISFEKVFIVLMPVIS